MRILWHLQTIIFVILVTRKLSAFCQYAQPCNFNQMCICKTEETRSDVTCLKVPFRKLPNLQSAQYRQVDIMMSDVEIVENEAFGSAQIESLRLMNNRITVVGNRAFASMENTLRSLDMSYNKLTAFPYKALHGINHLDWLNLHSNEINVLNWENEFFVSWSRVKQTLQTLYLGDNDLIDISVGNPLLYYERLTWLNVDANKLATMVAAHLPTTLKTLSYNHNHVQQFPLDLLESLAELTRLYVRGNYLRQLPLSTLRKAKRIEKLDLGENLIELTDTNLSTAGAVLTVRDLHLDSNRIRRLPARAFRGSSVARLYLARNRLRFIDEKAFVDLANSLEYLDVESNELEDITSAFAVFKRLKYLYASSNRLSNISAEIFDNLCPTLKAISLSGNQLTRLPRWALEKCDKLSHLNLGYNFIRELADGDFDNWARNLDTLLLRNNRISEIGPNAFHHCQKLRELSLSFNKIVNVHEKAFVDLRSSLESLEMSFGLYREELTSDFLKPLNYLMWLALDNNEVNTITTNAFHSLHNLQYLNLDTNAIVELPVGVFSSKAHKHLRDVRLSNNHLTAVRRGSFVDLNELQSVIVCRNNVRKIENNSFVNLPNVANIVLSVNRIAKIEANSFVNLPNLSRLDLQQNAINVININAFVNVSNPVQSLSLNLSVNELREIEVEPTTTTPLYLNDVDISVNNLQNVPRSLLEFCGNSITRLDLSYNRISKLNEGAFKNLASVRRLSIKSNSIFYVHKRAFSNLTNLQILDLSDNRIEYLSGETFSWAQNLRFLNLARNNLRTLTRDLLANTAVESLDLSSNLLNVMPGTSIGEVGDTLRVLDLSDNHIEHLDSTMFSEVASLSSLNLASNKLNILPDNVFTNVGNLLTLDISANPLRANFKELFHYVQRLRRLNLAETGLNDVPHLPLPNLVTLRLSKNRIEKLSVASIDNLIQLRRLYLDNNRFKSLPSNVWSHLPLLKELDVSNNPIKVLSKESFLKLARLQTLNIQHLNHLERFDADTFVHNKVLTNIRVDTNPRIDKNRFHLGSTLSNVPSLRTVSVRVMDEKLDDQLAGSFHSKLKEIEINGPNLRYISRNAFRGIEKAYDLILRIRYTLVEDLPIGLFEGIQNIAHLSLDLSNNRLLSLSPAVLYSNITNWENVGTKLLDGGLVLKNNPWSCDCGLVWLGHWLRRWLRETVEIHTLIIKEAQQMENMAREATCLDQRTNRRIPIVDLRPEDLSCQASALSGDGSSSHLLGNHLLGCLIKTIAIIGFSQYLWSF